LKFTHKNKSLRLGAGLLAAFALASTLTACGGGDGDAPASTAAVVTLPAAGTSGSYQQAGTLNYLVFFPDGTTLNVPATVAGTSPTWTLTLRETGQPDLIFDTVNNWTTWNASAGFGVLLALRGNAGLICATSTDAGKVGVSGNLTQVTDLTLLRGKSFTVNQCDGGSYAPADVVTVNPDGTGTYGVDSVTAADVTSLFSAGGLLIDGTTEKLRAFRTVDGDYVVVQITDDPSEPGGLTQKVSLFVPLMPS
jgi:hypothetical protein